MSSTRVTKAIIATAGWGTRRMPVAKSVEKCMLPLGNRPTVDYLVQDCVDAGVTDIYFVVSGSAEQLRSYYSRNVELENYLRQKEKLELLDAVTPPQVTFHFIEQDLNDGRYGTTVPVWLARDYIADDELVLIAVGDAAFRDKDGSSDIVRAVQLGKPAIIGVRVGDDVDLSRTGGVISMTDTGDFRAIVEHADPAVEPSRLKNSAMYVLPGAITELVTKQIEERELSYNGEYFFTNVINEFAKEHTVGVYEATGEYLDSGDVGSWVRANEWLRDNNQL